MNIGLKKGGTMKMLKIDVTIIILFFSVLSFTIFAIQPGPATVMAGYDNKISQIAYSVGSHDQHALTLLCQKNPICIYTPLSYADHQDASLTKTYFLPRTQCEGSKMQSFYTDLHESFKLLGIDLKIDDMTDLNYGVRKNHGIRLSFTMQPDHAYDIVKHIDSDKKTVSFTLVAKI